MCPRLFQLFSFQGFCKKQTNSWEIILIEGKELCYIHYFAIFGITAYLLLMCQLVKDVIIELPLPWKLKIIKKKLKVIQAEKIAVKKTLFFLAFTIFVS